ncbi:MAG TPA: hypothetical protein VFI36_10140 [Arthrobacter sp.]|nr:hypothetical protein [Arthrobacter sp.]
MVALVPVLSLGLLGGSVAMAAPAQAETSRNGCTVDPLAPRDFRGNRVDFKIKVHCYGEKTVQIRQLRYEDEPGPRRSDDFVGSSYFTQKFERRNDARTIHSFDHVATLTAGAHALAPVCAGCRVLGGLLGSGSGKTVDGATIWRLASRLVLQATEIQFDFPAIYMDHHLCVFDARGGQIVHER